MSAPTLTPPQTVRALAYLFPAAKFGSEIVVTVVRGVVTSIKAPRAVTSAELAAALAAAPAPTPPGRDLAKLTVRRRLRDMGKEDAFDAALDSIPHARRDYDDAQTLNTADPLFTTAAPLLKSALGITDAQFAALIAP